MDCKTRNSRVVEVKQSRRHTWRIPAFLLTAVWVFSFSVSAQEAEAPRYHSRAELASARQNLAKTFPEETRALRTLHLPPDKVAQVESKLRRFEVTTRGAREELQTLLQQEVPQGINRPSKSQKVNELRTSLEQAKNQLHSQIKSLLTTQQQEQFERRLQKEHPKREGKR
jgi:hypothetical protein